MSKDTYLWSQDTPIGSSCICSLIVLF